MPCRLGILIEPCQVLSITKTDSGLPFEKRAMLARPLVGFLALIFAGAFLVEAETAALEVEEAPDRFPARADPVHPQAELRLVQLSTARLPDRIPDLRSAVWKCLLQSLPEDGQGLSCQTHQAQEGAPRAAGSGALQNCSDQGVGHNRDLQRYPTPRFPL